jgi:hypothetical protein
MDALLQERSHIARLLRRRLQLPAQRFLIPRRFAASIPFGEQRQRLLDAQPEALDEAASDAEGVLVAAVALDGAGDH